MEIVSPAKKVRKERHVVRFYDEDESLLEEVADFLDVALRSGGTSIVIATAEHIQTLRRHLGGLGTQADQAPWFTGELIAFEAEVLLAQFMINDWPDEQRFNEIVGNIVREACRSGRPVHAFGEMVAILCDHGFYDAAIRLEQLWNGLHDAGHVFSLFCAYPWSAFSSADLLTKFQQVCRQHDHACSHSAVPARPTLVDLPMRVVELEQQNRVLQGELERASEATQTLRHREQELADFVNNAAEGIHRVGSDGTILWANKAELAMLGYRWEEYVGHHIAQFHVDQPVIESILVRLRNGDIVYDQPARLRCKDGSVKHVVIHSNACFEDNKLRHTRCFTRDATDRLHLEQAHREREALLTELTHMNQAKDEFLAMLAHELRNPLAPISAAAQALTLMASDPERVKQTAAIVARQAGHLAALLDDLLDVARVTRGLIELDRERIDLRAVVTAAIEQVAPLVSSLSHVVAVEMSDMPAWIRGDYKRLVQVMANILTNAAKYTPAGGLLDIRLTSNAHEVELTVSDNGIGMAADLVDKAFQLFVQGERSSNRSQGGLGVGLALVRSLVHAHGGTIGARSPGVGQGSTFTLRLPLLHHTDVPAVAPACDDATSPSPSCLGVLIVDDNIDAAKMLEMLLEIAGHRVTLAHTAADGICKALELAPDVCLLDIGLPDMDGRDLAARLRTMPVLARSQLIAVSGYGQPHDRQRSIDAGFDDHLVKPVKTDELLALLAHGRA
ncbi:hybrid sensor histidine kinase/response regulator [Massilia pseudoviolaceinigra]|uniref:hybrid sensor histidine kinase/response regulator n=1 Tax=Massilia pseudoviolaceinigra TaxID=3057165 RepID=UPI002796B44E|nr:ATP-binding protein [Massilia sp. CCM 9206]MDQ1921582.1 ATP-binding protein [Massilia sp. CCM 9206]